MQSVATYGILYHLFAIAAAYQKRHSISIKPVYQLAVLLRKILDTKLNYYGIISSTNFNAQ